MEPRHPDSEQAEIIIRKPDGSEICYRNQADLVHAIALRAIEAGQPPREYPLPTELPWRKFGGWKERCVLAVWWWSLAGRGDPKTLDVTDLLKLCEKEIGEAVDGKATSAYLGRAVSPSGYLRRPDSETWTVTELGTTLVHDRWEGAPSLAPQNEAMSRSVRLSRHPPRRAGGT